MEMGLLKSRNLLQPYDPPEAESYPANAKDKEKSFTAIYARNFVLGYNTAMIPEKDRRRDWPELLDPKWKGKFGIDEEEFEWYGTLIDYWGREKTAEYMKALAAQQPTLRRGHNLLAQLLAAGEFPVAIVFPFEIEQLKRRGAPVEWSNASDPIVTSINLVAHSVKAPHPNAARVFINYILSERGSDGHQERLPRSCPPRRQADGCQTRPVDAENPLRARRHVQKDRRVRKGIPRSLLEEVKRNCTGPSFSPRETVSQLCVFPYLLRSIFTHRTLCLQLKAAEESHIRRLRFVAQIVAINLIAVMSSAARDLSDPVALQRRKISHFVRNDTRCSVTLIE